MAELFLARRFGPQGFARSVAIKRILPHLSEDQTFVTMFLDEARIAAGIQHPNVVSVEELNNDDDGLYMVMEYLAGESLAALMHRLTITKQTLDPEIAAHDTHVYIDGVKTAVIPQGAMLEITFPITSSVHVNTTVFGIDDLIAMVSAWLSDDGQWDIAPTLDGDGTVNLSDFSDFSSHWQPQEP